MIRKIGLLTLFSSLFLVSCATMMGSKITDPSLREMEKVLEFPEQSQDDLYIKANAWFVETFTSAESVIEFQDKESGKIMGKYVFSYSEGLYFYDVKQTLSIDLRDGKVRAKIINPLFRATGDALNGRYAAIPAYKPLESVAGIDKARLEWLELIRSLQNHLNKDTSW